MINGAWLTTNRSCNNKCKWCYAQNALDNDMNFDDAKKCVDALEEINVKHIVLIGGEPTIYKHFIELIEYIKRKNISVSLATNGRKFNDINFVKKCIESKIDGINISIKALNEKEYYEKTNSYGLNELIKGYSNLCNSGFVPTLSYVITSNDIQQIDTLIKLLEENTMNNIIFQFVKPVIDFKSDSIMDLKDMGYMTTVIYNKMKNTELKYKIEVSFPLCLIDDDTLDDLLMEDKITTCCHVQAGRGIVFDTDFKVLPCNHFVNFPYVDSPIMLNAKSIINLFESENVIKFREKSKCYPSIKCAECSRWGICGGGCFTRWLYLNPEQYIC